MAGGFVILTANQRSKRTTKKKLSTLFFRATTGIQRPPSVYKCELFDLPFFSLLERTHGFARPAYNFGMNGKIK